MEDNFDPKLLAKEFNFLNAEDIDKLYISNNKDLTETLDNARSLDHERAMLEISQFENLFEEISEQIIEVDPIIQEDENLTGQLLDYICDTLLIEDDGTGPRLLWVLEKLDWQFSNIFDAKKLIYGQIIARNAKRKQLKTSEIKSLMEFETTMIMSYFADEQEAEIREALLFIGDPFFIISILSLLKFNMAKMVPIKEFSKEKFEWNRELVYFYHHKYYERSNYKRSSEFFVEQREKIVDLEISQKQTYEHFHQARIARENLEEIVDLYLETRRKTKEYKDQHEKSIWDIYGFKNPKQELRYCCIDLHGLYFKETLIILEKMLPEIQQALDSNKFEPNFNKNNHVVKVVCGAGTHSANGVASLKYKVPQYLQDKKFDIYTLEAEGAVFVHLMKN